MPRKIFLGSGARIGVRIARVARIQVGQVDQLRGRGGSLGFALAAVIRQDHVRVGQSEGGHAWRARAGWNVGVLKGRRLERTGSGSKAWTKCLRTEMRTTLKKLPLKGELDTV